MSASGVCSPRAVALLAAHLEASQWASEDDLAAAQRQHLVRLAEHARAGAPHFARRLAQAGLTPAALGEPGGLEAMPILTRRDLQAAGSQIHSAIEPRGHGDVWETRTSGSTGEPVVVRRTGTSALFWQALAMRELGWHRRDVTGRLCAIRANVSAYTLHDGWGAPASLFAQTGARLMLPINASARQLVDWVTDFTPTFLVIYPSTLAALAAECRDRHIRLPGLQHILTIGETLPVATRADAEAAFDAAVADCYSSQEFGYIAAQCPETGLYHVMSESLLAEVLTDDGRPCQPGDIGRVTITDLHNYATPLVRYQIGDFAEVAAPCRCGRGLPSWTRIVGRERNLVQMPDGSRHWPVFGLLRGREVAPIVQYQLVQEAIDRLEMRLVVERALSPCEEEQVCGLVRRSLGAHFALRVSYYVDRIPSGPSGKFEEFICALDGDRGIGAGRPSLAA